jgi:hypothetical protein
MRSGFIGKILASAFEHTDVSHFEKPLATKETDTSALLPCNCGERAFLTGLL